MVCAGSAQPTYKNFLNKRHKRASFTKFSLYLQCRFKMGWQTYWRKRIFALPISVNFDNSQVVLGQGWKTLSLVCISNAISVAATIYIQSGAISLVYITSSRRLTLRMGEMLAPLFKYASINNKLEAPTEPLSAFLTVWLQNGLMGSLLIRQMQ